MAIRNQEFDLVHLHSRHPRRVEALHLILGADAHVAGQPATTVSTLLAHVEQRSLRLDLVYGAFAGEALVSACAAIESPGRAAMVFFANDDGSEPAHGASVAALTALQSGAWGRSIALLEVLLAPQSSHLGRTLSEAGFRPLTRLLYLDLAVQAGDAPTIGPFADIEWTTYASSGERLFRDVLDATYVDTEDCRALAGLRSTTEILASHRASGVHDPNLWWVASRNGEPVGILLLTRLPPRDAMEVVYVGVTKPARGRGIGSAMVHKAIGVCAAEGVTTLTLAVDRANTPARRMYARFGFCESMKRDAWIASPAWV
ncbi:MAG: GNAT family N-acetyltransferase [Planctomycetes bacterium]|nr:GNAT family N-acetyltransferase [Planctomycetota bacterium]